MAEYEVGTLLKNIHSGVVFEITTVLAINKGRSGLYIKPIDRFVRPHGNQFVNICNLKFYIKLGPAAHILYSK